MGFELCSIESSNGCYVSVRRDGNIYVPKSAAYESCTSPNYVQVYLDEEQKKIGLKFMLEQIESSIKTRKVFHKKSQSTSGYMISVRRLFKEIQVDLPGSSRRIPSTIEGGMVVFCLTWL